MKDKFNSIQTEIETINKEAVEKITSILNSDLSLQNKILSIKEFSDRTIERTNSRIKSIASELVITPS